jgi:hypothetical protein
VKTLYLRVGERIRGSQLKLKNPNQGDGTHGANKNSSSPSTSLLLIKFTCLHLVIRFCCASGSEWMIQCTGVPTASNLQL